MSTTSGPWPPTTTSPVLDTLALYTTPGRDYRADVDQTTAGAHAPSPQAADGRAADVDLRDLLVEIVRSACALTGARYGALGVLGQVGSSGQGLVEFVAEGLTPEQRAAIGEPPRGRGLLGHLISHPEILRVDDLSAHPSSTGFPAGHPRMTSLLGLPIRVRDRVFGNLYLTDKTPGGRFTPQDERAVLALASLAGLAIEHAHLLVVAERRARWTEATAAMRSEIARTDPSDASASIVRHAMSAGHALAALVVDVSTTSGRLTVEAQVGDIVTPLVTLAESLRSQSSGPTTPGSAHRVDLGQEHVVVAPLSADPEGTHHLVVVLARSEDVQALDDEQDLVTGYAAQATLALERRSAQELREQLVVSAERERIARDLHDVVVQRLFAIGLQLTPLSARLGPPFQARLDWIIDDLDLTIDEIRGTIGGLLPSMRRDSLRAQLRSLVAEYALVLPRRPALKIVGALDTAVPSRLHHDVVAVLRESLSNVARHAHAEQVSITIEATSQRLTCTVVDDGTGVVLGPGTVQSGLKNLAARAAVLGGSCTVVPGDDSGTVVVWQVPLGRPSESDPHPASSE